MRSEGQVAPKKIARESIEDVATLTFAELCERGFDARAMVATINLLLHKTIAHITNSSHSKKEGV